MKFKSFLFGLAMFVCAGNLWAGSFTGVVNANFQLETASGETYEIVDTDAGNELVMLIDTQVKVNGNVEEEAGIKYLSVTSFQVIEDTEELQ